MNTILGDTELLCAGFVRIESKYYPDYILTVAAKFPYVILQYRLMMMIKNYNLKVDKAKNIKNCPDKMFQGGAQSHVNELLYTSKDIFKASFKLCVLLKYEFYKQALFLKVWWHEATLY